MTSQTVLFSLIALACFAALAFSKPLEDEAENFRVRRATYRGLAARRTGYPTNTRQRYVAPASLEEEEQQQPEEQPEQDEEEQPLEDEEQQEEPTPAPVKPVRGSRPVKTPRAKQPPQSRGNSATSTAVAYGGDDGEFDGDKPQEEQAPAKPQRPSRARPQRPVKPVVQNDEEEEEEETPVPVKPQRPRARPQRPVKPVQQDDEEEEETPVPVKPQRPSRARPVRPSRPDRPVAAKPTRPQRPQQPEQETPAQQGGGGVTAIAASYSVGDGASAKSQAVAYGGGYSGRRFRQWWV